MRSSIFFVAAAFLCLVAFPTSTVGKNFRFWPKPIEAWPNPSEISRNKNTADDFTYGDSKVWKCIYSNGSAPAISISPFTPSPSTPSTPSPPPPPTPKVSPPPSTPSSPPPTPKISPSPPPPTPKTSPPPSQTPKKSPSPSPPPPSDDVSSNPPHRRHHSLPRYQHPWEHVEGCMRNMGHATMCRVQIEMSFYTRMFRVSDRCCNLIVNMKNECDDVVWGFFTDPFFLPLVRCTCHVSY